MAEINEILRAVRTANFLTQKQFADKLGLKQSAYSMIESGTNKPSIDLIKAIAKTFNVHSDLFLVDYDLATITGILNTKNDNIKITNNVNTKINEDVNEDETGIFDNKEDWDRFNNLTKANQQLIYNLKKKNRELFDFIMLLNELSINVLQLKVITDDVIYREPYLMTHDDEYQNFTVIIGKTLKFDNNKFNEFFLNYLSQRLQYKEAIETFNKAIETFLETVKPLDVTNRYYTDFSEFDMP